jgi:glycosyltransferase involved in cell wall biosynthesis
MEKNAAKKRILYYTGSLVSGGAERQLIYTALAAKEMGYEVRIVVDYPINHYDHMLKDKDIDVIITNTTKKTLLKRYKSLMKIIKEYNPEIIHSFLSAKNLWAMLVGKRARIPVRVASIRNTDDDSFKAIKLYSKWATRIICNSKLASEIASNKFSIPKDKLEVVYNGIDLERFSVAQRAVDIRSELGLEPQTLIGVTLARFAEQKNHLGLVRALAILHEKGALNNVHHLLVGNIGDRTLFDRVTDEIKICGLEKKITYLGIRSDIPEILQMCDFMVLPSLYEGFPNVVMEAMATKTFVIATPTGGTPELVRDGVTGILTRSPSPEDLVAGIERYFLMSKQDCQTILDNAYECIQEYSIEKMIRKVKKIYDGKVDSCRED